MASTWLKVTNEIEVRLSYPCNRDYGRGELEDFCREPYRGHGHILVRAPEGIARIPFACYSKKGIEEMLGYMSLRYGHDHYDDMAAVLLANDTDACSLPDAATLDELAVFSDHNEVLEASDINFVDDA